MPNVPFQVGDGIQIGAAVITASGAAIVLPANTSVGGTQVATSTDVSTGGGPKITNLQITDNSWAVLDDTAVDTAGGYVLITGTNFVSGALVYFNQTPANSVAFVSATTLRVTVPALTAGTYIVYVINPDGGTAIRVPGLTASANPAWQTASALPEQYDGVAITLNLVATDATSYTLISGSLPPGLSLNTSTGAITGTVSGVTVDTTYTFTVRATDAQLQDSPRTFTVTITVSDPYFRLTTLLLSGSAISANTVIRDSSTNNFNLTVSGDSRASNFTPYGTGWSVYFDGTGDLLSGTITGGVGSGDFTLEYWVYHNTLTDWQTHFATTRGVTGFNIGTDATGDFVFYDNVGGTGGRRIEVIGAITVNRWYHFAISRSGTSLRGFLDGTLRGTYTTSQDYSATAFYIGALDTTQEYTNGYISNLRLVKGTALYTANFTPATTNLTTVANTSLLTCNVNRFRDSSANNFAITRNGDARVVSFNPFNITNTGVDGSMYFDGTGDYLSLSTPVVAATGDFTIEGWFYLTNAIGTRQEIIYQTSPTDGAAEGRLIIAITNTGYLSTFVGGTNSPGANLSSEVIQPNTWYHFAYTRNSNTFTQYLNGVSQGTPLSGTVSINQNPLLIGYNPTQSPQRYWFGYLSDIRIVNGSAVYTANFTPPTAPLTAITNTQLLTLQYDQPHNNHTFLDSSSNQFLITRSGNATQGTFSPFSPAGWSVYFDGSYDCIKVASDAAFGLGTGNFTIELWVNFDDYYAPQSRLAGQYTSGNTNGWQIYKNANSYNLIFNTNTADHISYNWSSVATNTWYYIAVVRSGTGTNQTIMYINGVNVATGTCSHSVGANQVVVGGLDWAASYSTKGYISSFRYSNIARTIVVPTVPYSSDANTLVLTCQSNRFIELSASRSITIAETPKIQAFSPFAATAVYNPVSHGGSGYVDGSGDYFILTNESAYDFGDGNFSIDFWYYPLSAQGYGGIYMRDGQDYPLGIYSGTSITPAWPECSMAVGTTTTWFATGINTSGVQKYAWNYIAFTRVGNTFRAFTNGVLSSVVTASGTMGSGGTPWIGKNGTAAGQSELSMYLSGFRMTKGGIPTLFSTSSTTTGTTIFDVPTQPFTANDSLTGGSLSILANFADAAILDSTGRNVIETVADAKTSSVVTKFTGGSMYFDGTGDRLMLPASPNLTFGTSDFTIEMWVNSAAQASNSARIMGNGAGGSWGANKWIFTSTTASNPNKYTFQFWNYNSGGSDLLVSSSIANNSTWTHVAITRSGSTFRMFVNGTLEATQTSANSLDGSSSVYLEIGRSGLTGEDWAGYINDLRITRGYARYTANFTAPTAPARLK